jgi:cytidylate kinase
LKDKGNSANLATLSRELEERDQRDATREAAPLKPAADAASLDSSEMTIDAVVDWVLNRYRERTSGNRRS